MDYSLKDELVITPRAERQDRDIEEHSHRDCLLWKGCTNLALTAWPNIKYVKHVALGETHSAILTHGKVYCFGSNDFGQLGNGTFASTIEPTEVKSLTGLGPDHVAVGGRHTVCSTHEGSVYCWGDSSKGQCGTGELDTYSVPALVQEFNVVMRRIACCSMATVCLTTGGAVFVWGSGAALGRPRVDMLAKPMQLTFLDARRVIDVACGSDFCVAVAEKLSPLVRKFAQKNNYVVVHCGSSGGRSSEDETAIGADERKPPSAPPAANTCPLGLELAEEHVFLVSSEEPQPGASAHRPIGHSIDQKVGYVKGTGIRHGLPTNPAGSKPTLSQVDNIAPNLSLKVMHSNDDQALVGQSAVSAATTIDDGHAVSQPLPARSATGNTIVADQDAAMAFLKKQLGEVVSSPASVAWDSASSSLGASQSGETADNSRHGGPFLSRLVSSGTSSAAAVMGGISSMIQDSLVPSLSKLPLIDRLNFASTQGSNRASFSLETPASAGSSTPNEVMSVLGGYETGDTSEGARASENQSPSAKRLVSGPPSEQQSLARVPDHSKLTRDLRVSLNTEVCSWGKGHYGQLGHGDTLDRSQPCFIACLNEENVVSISAGSHHVLALTADGRVFGWGDNLHDQLGLRKKQCILEPQLLEVVQFPVSKVAAGDRHSLFLHDHPRDAKPCLFYTGRDGGSSGTTVGVRIPFVDKSGLITDVFAGDMCNCCAVINSSPSASDLCFEEVKMAERDFYKRLTDVASIVVKKIMDSDIFSLVDRSSYGGAWRDVVDSFYALVDAVGTNVQLLGRADSGSAMAAATSSVFFADSYLVHFEKYSGCYHSFIAVDGVAYLVGVSSAVLRGVREQMGGLLESCRLEGSGDDLHACVALLLQFPLRRISEYRQALEKMSLTLDNSEILSSALSALSSLEACLTSDYNSAQMTQIFWEKCPEKLASALKTSGRRVITDSKSVPLQLHGAAKLSSQWFILFNDVFVHVQSAVHRCYPLLTIWVEQLPEEDPVRLGLRLVMPEDVLVFQASNSTERAEWLLRLHEAVYHSCHRRRKHASEGSNSSAVGGSGQRWRSQQRSALGSRRSGVAAAGRTLALSPATRQASHTFTKPGRLCGATYTGAWRNGKACGDGEIVYSDGSKYRGKFRDGEHCGYGVYRQKLAAGGEELLEGDWKDGKLDGYGFVRFSNGDTYEGLFKEGVKHGHGVLKSGSARTPGLWSVYVGEWRADRRHGYGVLDDASRGEKYLGQWLDDSRTGSGVLVALDGSYCEGTFVGGKLIGNGLMLTSDGTSYEGQFAGGTEINGRGRLTLANGDYVDGQFSGSWSSGLKVSGMYHKPFSGDAEAGMHHQHLLGSTLPRTFGKYSVPAERKWEDLFRYTRAMLGCIDDKPASADKVWENVAVRVVASKQRQPSECKSQYLEDLEKIPSRHSTGSLTREHYIEIQDYLRKAFDSSCHPLGQLVISLVDVYRATYLGAGAQPHLLHHAKEEVKSLMRRLYGIVRLLFPDLPENGGPCLIASEKREANGTTGGTASFADDTTALCDASLRMEDGEVASWSLLLHPIFLPKVYPPLFSLYALQNETEDEKYWHRVERFNKQSDVALMAYLGVDEKFWFLNDVSTGCSDERLPLAKDKCYLLPIEALQQLTTAFTPAEKLLVIQQTFTEVNKLVKHHLGQKFVWTMDDLFPVFQFVVIRARLRHLGAEIHFTNDLMDRHLEHGELGLMFTTIKACHFQIQTEKLL